MTKRPAIGIKIIERQRKGNKSFSLYAKNGVQFAILINYSLFGLCLRSKVFEFNDQKQAEMVFDRIVEERQGFRFTGPLSQKRSFGS